MLTGEIGETPVVAVYDDRYDTGYVYQNPDEQAVRKEGGQITVDGETYMPDSLPLARILAFDAMWFAWVGYYPATTIYA